MLEIGEFYCMKKRHLRLMIALALLILITISAVVYASVIIFNQSIRENREDIIVNVSKLASEQIDGNKVKGWLENGPDEDYINTEKTLKSILHNTPYLQYLYVYQIKPDGCYVVFDFDAAVTDSEQDNIEIVSASEFGSVIEFDESFLEYLPTLLEGGRIGTIESNDKYGWLLTRYEPVYDSTGACVAYVGTDISMVDLENYVKRYITQVSIIAVLFFVGCVVIGIRLIYVVRQAEQYDNIVEKRIRDRKLLREIIEAFAKIVDLKDSYTQGHSMRVAKYTKMLAQELGYDEDTVEKYYDIALMHDIGKVGIPDSVLNKQGKLTEEEYELIKSHAIRGYEVLKNISLMPEIAIGAEAHHERPDGKGYPNGWAGDEIPRVA